MPFTNFETLLNRVYDATGIGSQNELAKVMDINRSAITQAKKKDGFPAKWLLNLYRLYVLNPDWLETGSGPTYLQPSDPDSSEFK